MTLPDSAILDRIPSKCRDCIHTIHYVDDDLCHIECYVYEIDLQEDPDTKQCKLYVSKNRHKNKKDLQKRLKLQQIAKTD